MDGVVMVGQVAVEVATTLLPVQVLAPAADSVSKYVQQFSGTTSLPVKFVHWPGARTIGPKTGVLFVGRLLTTVTLVSVILPALLTIPENIAMPPGGTGLVGHCL